MTHEIEWHRPRPFPDLVWGWLANAAEGRVAVCVPDRRGRVVAEAPRGASILAVRFAAGESIPGVEAVQRHGTLQGAAVRFVDGPEFRPSVRDGTTVSVRWAAGSWASVRIRALAWTPAAIEAGRPVALGRAHIGAAEGFWAVPDQFLQGSPLELLFTPLNNKGQQGLTESLLLPPRVGRVEVRLRHMLIPDKAQGQLRRLRVQVRAHHPAPRPQAVAVHWEPLRGEPPQVFDLPWPANREYGELELKNISLAGDVVRVRIQPASAGVEYVYAAQLAAEDLDGEAAVVFGAGIDLTESPPFQFGHSLPPGPPLTMLPQVQTLPAVPQLTAAVAALQGDTAPPELPPALLTQLLAVVRAAPSADALRRVLGRPWNPLADYAARPQLMAALAHDRALLEVAARWGGASPSAAEQILHCWVKEQGKNSAGRDVPLRKFLEAGSDEELDWWLELLARGAAPELLREFRAVRRWAVTETEMLRASLLLDKCRRQPIAVLVPELLPGTEVFGLFEQAVQAERLALAVQGTYADFDRAETTRETARRALTRHLRAAALADVAAETVLRPVLTALDRDLTTEPAAILAELRRQATSAPVPATVPAPPVLYLEELWTALGVRRRDEAELHRRRAADWCRELFATRRLPGWPWVGTSPAGDPEPEALAAWRREAAEIRALPTGLPEIAPAARAAVKNTLAWVAEAARASASPPLQQAVQEMAAHADQVAAWLDEERTRAGLQRLIGAASALQTKAARNLAAPHQDAARTAAANGKLLSLAEAATTIQALLAEETAWTEALAEARHSPRAEFAALAAERIEGACRLLAGKNWATIVTSAHTTARERRARLEAARRAFGSTISGETAPDDRAREERLRRLRGLALRQIHPESFRRLLALLDEDAATIHDDQAAQGLRQSFRVAFLDRWERTLRRHPCPLAGSVPAGAAWFDDRARAEDWGRIAEVQRRLESEPEGFDRLRNALLTSYSHEPSFALLLASVPYPTPRRSTDRDLRAEQELHAVVQRARAVLGHIDFLTGADGKVQEANDALDEVRARAGSKCEILEALNNRLRTHACHLWKLAQAGVDRAVLPQVHDATDLAAAFAWLHSDAGRTAKNARNTLRKVGFILDG